MRRTLMILALLLASCDSGSVQAPTAAPEAPAPVAVAGVPDGFKLVPVEFECKAPPVPCEGAGCTPTPTPGCQPTERPGDECAWVAAECRWVCIPPPTPPPPPPPVGNICHVSNKGAKDGNVNLVLSPKAGDDHASHLNADKFCPPDHVGDCSCERAIADAKACGVPATGGFTCKVQP